MYEFKRDTGKRPKYLYLGREEWDEFVSIVVNLGVWNPSATTLRPPSFAGMRVILVQEDSHLGVGL